MAINKKNTIQVCGWWGSANLGDRYQPLIIANYLQSLNLQWQAMGYHPTHKTSFIEKYIDSPITNVEVFDPDPSTTSQYIIAVVGSLSSDYYSTKLLKTLVEQNDFFKKIVIWGGFQDIDLTKPSYSQENWQWLSSNKVTFIARSHWDLICLRQLTQSPNIGLLGGDPMCNWIPESYLPETSIDNPIALIISQPCFVKQPQVAQELIDIASKNQWKVGCFDGYADKALIKQHHYTHIKSPAQYLKWLNGVGGIISVRLHAAVLAAVVQIPTTAIGTNEKFAAIGLHGLDSRTLFPVTLEPQAALSMLGTNDFSATKDYLTLSRQTLQSLPRLLLIP